MTEATNPLLTVCCNSGHIDQSHTLWDDTVSVKNKYMLSSLVMYCRSYISGVSEGVGGNAQLPQD